MTRTTQRNIITHISKILTTNISPLYEPWSCIHFSTTITLNGFPALSSYPLMQSSVTNAIPLPVYVFFSCYFKGLFSGPFLRSWVSSEVSGRLSTVNKFFISYAGVTRARTEISFANFRRRLVFSLSTLVTICLNHKSNYRPTLGERQVNVNAV